MDGHLDEMDGDRQRVRVIAKGTHLCDRSDLNGNRDVSAKSNVGSMPSSKSPRNITSPCPSSSFILPSMGSCIVELLDSSFKKTMEACNCDPNWPMTL
jgi:hypothetical protein